MNETLVKKITTLSAVLVIAIALLVIAGWYLKIQILVQIYASFAPMQFNTALGFLLSGLGLFSLSFQRVKFAKAFGFLVLSLGGASLLQYVFHVDFHIDNFFVDPVFLTKTTHPGRMAPSTALCFVIVGAALYVSLHKHHFLLGFSISALFLVLMSLGGYIVDVNALHGLSTLTRMALHTSICFLILSATLLFWNVNKLSNEEYDGWQFIPFAVFIIISTLSFFVWYTMQEYSYADGRVSRGAFQHGSNGLSIFLSVCGLCLASFLYVALRFLLSSKDKTSRQVEYQKELLERAEEIASIGHWRLDLKTNALFWSKEIYRIHGVTPDTYTPSVESAVDFYHEDDSERVSAYLERVMADQADFTFEARLVTPSGAIRHVRSSGECRMNERGDIESVFGIFQDITELKSNLDVIEEQNHFLSLIMKTIPDLLFVKDQDFKIVQANPTFLNLYPEDMRDKVIGSTSTEQYDEKEAEEFLKYDRIAFQDGESEVEEKIQFPNGQIRTLLTKKVRFQKEDGQKYILGLARDITELKAAQKTLVEANEELEEFAYRTSHDLRSPLVSSISLLYMAQEAMNENDNETAMKSLQHVESSLTKLDNLVKDILVLTQAKNVDEKIQPIDIEFLVKEALGKFAHMQNFDRLKIETDYRYDGAFSSKLGRVQLIVENLISNAIKYQDPNEDQSFIQISTHKDAQDFVLTVKDNGLGIPENQHEKIFKMFMRFHNKVAFGSGLGLYMMQKSAKIIGGQVVFTPSKKGATFKLIVPRKAV